MIFKQFYLSCLAHASYLVGDEGSGVAAVVDPQRDVEGYVAFAREKGLRIGHVLLTHLHADFVAGHLELRERTGAKIYLGARAKAEYAFVGLADGAEVVLGDRVRLKILETPGHTVESISILLLENGEGKSLLTGDTLFIGDVGRPDLRAALGWKSEDLAGMLYDSLHGKILKLADELLVYPAHGAGSLCGKAISKETFSTLGEQRRVNYALQAMGKEAFVKLVTADQPEAPGYFQYDAALNAKEHATLEGVLAKELRAMKLEEVLEMQKGGGGGGQVLDTRDASEFGAAHLAGSVNVGLGGQFATWAGTVLDRGKPVVLVTAAGHERESAMRLGRIGFDNVAGYLNRGMHALDGRPELVRGTERLSAGRAAEVVRGGDVVLLDVRNERERKGKFIEGSLHVALNHLVERMGTLPRGKKVVVHCAGGYRSSIAASLLERAGFEDVGEIAGGLAAWEAAGLGVRAG